MGRRISLFCVIVAFGVATLAGAADAAGHSARSSERLANQHFRALVAQEVVTNTADAHVLLMATTVGEVDISFSQAASDAAAFAHQVATYPWPRSAQGAARALEQANMTLVQDFLRAANGDATATYDHDNRNSLLALRAMAAALR